MPLYQFSYLSRPGAVEIVDADSPEDAEDMARRRLLFSEPGFAIAILFDGVELNRLTQRSKTSSARSSLSDRAAHSPGRALQSALVAGARFPEHYS